MLTSLKPQLNPLWMNTSKKVVATEAAQGLALSHLSNAPDLMTDHGMVEGITGTEAMMIVAATGEVAAAAPTRDLVGVGLTMEVVEDTVGDEEEVTMTDEITVEEEGVIVRLIDRVVTRILSRWMNGLK